MKPREVLNLIVCCIGVLALPCGCGRSGSTASENGDAENRVKLCGFKEGHGVFVSDETRQALGLAIMEVTPKAIPQTIRGTARVFAAGKASMLVDTNQAQSIKAGQRVLLDKMQEAHVIAVESGYGPLVGTVELILGFTDPQFNVGAHVAAHLQIERSDALPAVPESSLLSAATGDYVFVANGRHFLRTPVKVAGRSEGWVAIADGLLEGDVVVTNGIEGLWCIELQATKGGYACCAVAKKQ